MKYFIGLNQGKKEVSESLKASCGLFSVDTLQEQCKAFIDQREAYFAQLISNDIEPKVACQNIGICGEKINQKPVASTSAPVVSSTRYGKCIFGMKYWCTSRANAELCNVRKRRYFSSETNICCLVFRLWKYVNVMFGPKRIL